MIISTRRILFFSLIIFTIINSIQSNNILETEQRAGAKLVIKQELLNGIKRDFLPGLSQILANCTIPDQDINLNLKIMKIQIAIKNILLNLNISPLGEEVKLDFVSPNNLIIHIKNITGQVSFDDSFKLFFIHENSHIIGYVFQFDLFLELDLTLVESKEGKGKMIPSIIIKNIDLNLDFNYSISGDFLANIANNKIIKMMIVKLIKSNMIKSLINSLKKSINNLISGYMSNLPIYLDLNQYGLALDYEILENPKISDSNYLTINSKALVFNRNINETLTPPYNITNVLPDFEEHSKATEFFISDYSIQSAFYTLFLSNFLSVKIDSSILPKDFPVKLNTTSLDIVFNGVSEKYGIDAPVEIFCKALKTPVLNLILENIKITLSIECNIFIVLGESIREEAYRFSSVLESNLGFKVAENGNANININYLTVHDSIMIESTVDKTSISNIENLINFVSNLSIPYLNKEYLNGFKFNIPLIEGVDINDLTIFIRDKYIDIHVNPKFDNLVKNFNKNLEMKFLN